MAYPDGMEQKTNAADRTSTHQTATLCPNSKNKNTLLNITLIYDCAFFFEICQLCNVVIFKTGKTPYDLQ